MDKYITVTRGMSNVESVLFETESKARSPHERKANKNSSFLAFGRGQKDMGMELNLLLEICPGRPHILVAEGPTSS